MRLIDADALMELARNHINRAVDCNDIARFPTIEAEPVRHGEWVTDDLGRTHCSRCHKRLPYFHCYNDEPNSDWDEEWDEEIPETRYCPNCGAKMDLKGGMILD